MGVKKSQHDVVGKPTPYSGLRVLELATGPAGELTGLQFVHLGAEVVKIEPEGGAPFSPRRSVRS